MFGRPGPNGTSTTSSGLPTKTCRSRTRAEAGPLLQHLGVVVGGQQGLALAQVGHRQPADEVGQPREREPLQLGVLVQEVVDVPRLVADHQVVRRLLDDVVEDHEVVDQDLVHLPDAPGRRAGRARRTRPRCGRTRWPARRDAGWIRLAGILQHPGDRVLGEPVDLQVRGGSACSCWAMARSRRAWPRPIGEDRYSAAGATRARCPGPVLVHAPPVCPSSLTRPASTVDSVGRPNERYASIRSIDRQEVPKGGGGDGGRDPRQAHPGRTRMPAHRWPCPPVHTPRGRARRRTAEPDPLPLRRSARTRPRPARPPERAAPRAPEGDVRRRPAAVAALRAGLRLPRGGPRVRLRADVAGDDRRRLDRQDHRRRGDPRSSAPGSTSSSP